MNILFYILLISTMTQKNKSVDSSNKNCETQTIIFEMETTRNVGHCFHLFQLLDAHLA